MGSPDARDNEKPQHQVKLTKPFELGVYEVTQQQYEKVMGDNPSGSKVLPEVSPILDSL